MKAKVGDYMVWPAKELDARRTYDSQIEAEIRIRNQAGVLKSLYKKGGVVLQVVAIVTEDMVESA